MFQARNVLFILLALFSPVGAETVNSMADLKGKTIDLWTTKGEFLIDAELTDMKLRDEGAVTFTLKLPGGQKRQIPSSQVREIYIDNEPQDVVFNTKEKVLEISEPQRQARAVALTTGERLLLAKGKTLSPHLSKSQQKDQYASVKSKVKQLTKSFPEPKYRLYGNGPCFLFTDAPAPIAQKVDQHLSAAYLDMCAMMGLGPGENPLNGCFVFVLFGTEKDMYDFLENRDGKRPNPGLVATAGQSDGARWVVSQGGYQDAPSAAAVHLVGAFLEYGGSDQQLPEWLRQGLDQMTRAVSRENRDWKARFQHSVQLMRESQSLPSDFFDAAPGSETYTHFQVTQFDMTQTLFKLDQRRFAVFVRSIKLGVPWEEALKRSFDMTPAEFVSNYGKSVGVPQLVIKPVAKK